MFDSLPEILLQSDWIYWPERSVTKKEKEIHFQMKNKTNNNNFVLCNSTMQFLTLKFQCSK